MSKKDFNDLFKSEEELIVNPGDVFVRNPYKEEEVPDIPVIYPPGQMTYVAESKIPLEDRKCANCRHKFLHRCQVMGKGNLQPVEPGNYCDLWEEEII